VLGGLVWTVGLCGAGYLVGNSVPNIDRYLLTVVADIVLVSLTPLAVEAIRARRANRGVSTPGNR
jgi:membrane-associated protein